MLFVLFSLMLFLRFMFLLFCISDVEGRLVKTDNYGKGARKYEAGEGSDHCLLSDGSGLAGDLMLTG